MCSPLKKLQIISQNTKKKNNFINIQQQILCFIRICILNLMDMKQL